MSSACNNCGQISQSDCGCSPAGEYLIIEPRTPTEEEYLRGAALIPSMAGEGVRVWRVPAVTIFT